MYFKCIFFFVGYTQFSICKIWAMNKVQLVKWKKEKKQ